MWYLHMDNRVYMLNLALTHPQLIVLIIIGLILEGNLFLLN